MKAVDWRLVIRAVEVIGQGFRGLKEAHPEAFAAAVRLEDERVGAKMLPRRLDKQFLAGDEHGIRRTNAGRFESGVLARLADLEIECAAAVDDAAPVTLEPARTAAVSSAA